MAAYPSAASGNVTLSGVTSNPNDPGRIRVANFSRLEVVAWAVRLPVKAHTPPVEVLIVPLTVPLSVWPASVPSSVPVPLPMKGAVAEMESGWRRGGR